MPTTQKGGGPKTDFYWQLCTVLFKDDLKYSPALQHACELTGKAAAAARTAWTGKIKIGLKCEFDDMTWMQPMGSQTN
jgi:hypothetical protein